MTNLTDNQRRWAKTLLIIYPRSKKIIEALQESRMKMATQGFSHYGTEALYDKISAVNYRMQGIVNLCVLTRDTLKALGILHGEVLTLRHFKGWDMPDLAEYFETSVRNVYRRYDRALELFYSRLSAAGFGEHWLEREFGDDNLVKGIFLRSDGKIFSDKKAKKRRSERAKPRAAHWQKPSEEIA